MSEKVLFDPGYAKHITILSISIPSFYSEIDGIKSFNQKKVKFKLYFPKLQKITDNNVGFCLGSLLWALYIKTEHEGAEIDGNPCFGIDYNEAETVEEIDYSINYYDKLKKDAKYYLNQNYEINPRHIEYLNFYREFLILNKGFSQTKTVQDIELPSVLKPIDKNLSKKVFEKIQEVIKFGNLLDLSDIFEEVLK